MPAGQACPHLPVMSASRLEDLPTGILRRIAHKLPGASLRALRATSKACRAAGQAWQTAAACRSHKAGHVYGSFMLCLPPREILLNFRILHRHRSLRTAADCLSALMRAAPSASHLIWEEYGDSASLAEWRATERWRPGCWPSVEYGRGGCTCKGLLRVG